MLFIIIQKGACYSMEVIWFILLLSLTQADKIYDADMQKNDVLGKPISKKEIRQSKYLVEDKTKNHLDTIYKAGHFEGDIIRSDSEEKASKNRNAITNSNLKWPNAQIPYVISASFGSRERSVIANAIRIYQEKTCIRIRPRTTESNYVHFFNGGTGQCYSRVGRVGGRQLISIGSGCAYTATVLHEIMHAAGFYHEQSRTDRDSYVRINLQNVIPGLEYNFEKYSTSKITSLNARYDYCSVMHYPAYAFSKNRQPTISVLRSTSCQIGAATTFSDTDIRKLNTLYQCSGYPQVGGGGGQTCSDKNSNCPGWATRYCNDPRYSAWMSQNCAKSCNKCDGTTTCVDKNSNCPGWAARYCNDPTYTSWMSQNCAKSCNKC